MAERRVERRPEIRGAEERAPITVVPTRRTLEDRQVTELRAGLARVQEEITGLQEYYRSIRIPPASRTAVDLASEADRLEQALGRMRLVSNPILGERYQDELALLTRRIGEARTAAREGRLGQAVEILGQVNTQIGAIGQIFEYELAMLVNGIPGNVRIEGVTPDNARDSIFDGVEGLLLDFGTPNEPRGRVGMRAFRLYIDNAGAYNADNQLARTERDSVLLFVIEKGRTAREGTVYTTEQARADERTMRSFEQNAARLRTQIREYNISVITQWRSEVATLVQQEQDQQTKRSLEALQTDLDGIIRRLQARQDVADDQMRSVTSRYFLLTGRQAPLTEEDRVQRLVDAATELRGTGRTVTDNSSEWFGQRALDFLNAGNTQMASLALSMGLLERSARGGRRGAADYITEYSEIRDAIARGITPTPALMSRYLAQVESAVVDVDVDRLLREYARGGSREKRERILDGARVVRERMRAGDLEGARRLLDMVSVYTDLVARHNWRTWAGSVEMEGALDAERAGTNSIERFGNSLSYYSMMQQVEELRGSRTTWGRGLTAQREAFDAAATRIEEQARTGNLREARRGLTLLVMYVDAVQRLGVRRGGQITSLAEGERYAGMTNGLGAYSRGEVSIGGRPAQEVFVESYNSVQLAYIAREAERLEGLARGRSVGRDDVQAAITAARQRATAGDYRGALMLFEFVKEFYGQTSAEVPARGGTPGRPARREGWRYELFAARGAGSIQGYVRGKTAMLEALRLEINATDDQTHVSAAQLFEQGARRIDDTQFLVDQGETVFLRFGGAANFIPGEADTMGRIPLGERRAGAYEDYIDMSVVRTYDRQHALSDPVLRGRVTVSSTLTALVSSVDSATATGNVAAFNEGVAELSRRGVLTLDVLLYRVRQAAATGDRAAYNWAVTQLNRRLQDVVPRAVRARTIQQMRERVTQLRTGLVDVRGHYGDAVYATGLSTLARARQTAIDSLDTRASAYLTRLNELENNTEELGAAGATSPLNAFSQLVADANREGRIAGTLSYVNNQITQNEQFRQVVAQERSDRAAGVASNLRTAGENLAQARVDLLGGNFEAAYRSYRGATSHRMEALIFYRAEDSPTIDQVELSRVLTLQPLPQGRDSDYYRVPGSSPGDRGLDLRFHPVLRYQLAQRGRPDLGIPGFDYYMTGSMQVFSQLLTGHQDGFATDTRGTVSMNRAPSQTMAPQRIEHVARALAMTEVSVFGTPAGETRSMLLTDYVPRQVEVRRMMERIVTQNYDYSSEGGRTLIDGYFSIGQRNLEWMQQQAQTDRKIEMYTMIGIGLAALFIPKVGWAISGAIFIGLAADRVSTEIRVHGHASTEAWVMLGLAIGTLGLAGVATGLGRAALYTAGSAQTARGLVIAARLTTASTTISRINLGVGIGLMAYGGYHGIQALRAGRTEEGLVNLGLALFPLVHFGGARAMAYFRPQSVEPALSVQVARIIEARLPTMEGVRIPITEPEAVVRARGFQNNPRGLLDFIGEYMSGNSARRSALMESVPRQVRPIIQRLLANDVVTNAARAAREGAPVDISAMRAIRDAVRTFEIPPEPPPGGGRAIPRPQVDTAGLLNIEGLRAFLGDLMVPDGAPAARLNARAAARTRLEAIRGQNPDAATLVDGMLRNPTIAQDIASGQSTPFSMRMIGRAHEQLRGMLPDDTVAAQQQAQVVYTGQLAVQMQYEPAPQVAPALETGGGRTPIRASAGGDQSGRPPTVVPGVVRGAGEGREERGGAPREVTPGGRGQAPVERPPPQEVIQIGRLERMWRGARDAVRARLARRADARRVPPAPDEYIAEAQRFLDATIRSVGREAEVSAMVEEATRGLNADEAAQVATNIRNATRNVGDLVKLLYSRARSGRGAQETAQQASTRQEAARRALLRIYSFENVRTVMGELAAGDRVLADAIGYSRTLARQGAQGAGISVDAFLSGVSRRGFESGDITFIIQSLEAQTGARVAEINAGLGRVETQLGRVETQLAAARANPRVRPLLEAEGRVGTLETDLAAARRTAAGTPENTPARQQADARVQALETQLGDARRAVDTTRATVRGTRAGRTALERLENLSEQAVNFRSQIDSFNAQLRSPELQPLAKTEQVLGMRMTPSERAPMVQSLVDSRVLPESAIVDEFVFASRRAGNAARGLDVTAGGQEVRGRTQPNPVLENMRQAVDGSIGKEGAGTIDDVLLASLRSDELASAVSRRYGERVGNRFRELVREGDLDAVTRRLSDTLPSDIADPISGFVRSARNALAQDFAVMNLLGPRAGTVAGGGVDTAVAYGQQLAPVRTQLGQMWPARAGRWLLGNVWRYPMRGLMYDIGASGTRMWRNAPAEFGGMMKLRGTMRIGLQLLIWGAVGYYAGREIQDIYRTMSGAATIEEGRNEIRRRYGDAVANGITDDVARFIRSERGRELFNYIPSRFPQGRDIRPGTVDELRRALASEEIYFDHGSMPAILADSRQMSEQLTRINELLNTRRTGSTEDAQTATAELTRILQGFGRITVQQVDDLLSREHKQQLDVTDMFDLRTPDWNRRGLVVRIRDVVVETFLVDAGIQFQRGQGASAFLLQNTDAFVFIWSAVQNGTLPINYVDDAITALSRDGVMQGIRTRVTGSVTLDSQLRETLMREHLFLEIPAARGQVEGIRQNSFLGILDVRASQDPAFRPTFERILAAYRETPSALAAFNRFNLVEGANGEDIYGDAEALARLIIENPDTALQRARERGFVGPKVLGEIDPSLRNAGGEALVRFVREHSEDPSVSNARGLRTWVEARRQQITNLSAILTELSTQGAVATMSPAAIQAHADQQTETFRRRGWWRGPTPQERQASEEAARRRAGTPVGGGTPQRQLTADEQRREEQRQRTPRRPGFEMAPTERREETPPTVPQPQQTIPTMTPEAQGFYTDEARSAGLSGGIEGRLTRMYNDRSRGGDGEVLRRVFGEPTDQGPPAAVVSEIKAEIYRMLTSTRQEDIDMRTTTLGITVTGTPPAVTVTLGSGFSYNSLQSYIRTYANRRPQQQR